MLNHKPKLGDFLLVHKMGILQVVDEVNLIFLNDKDDPVYVLMDLDTDDLFDYPYSWLVEHADFY